MFDQFSKGRCVLFVVVVCALVAVSAAPAAGIVPELETLVVLDGESAGDEFCRTSTSGDFNGDGYMDFLVGAWGNDTGGTDAGRVYVYLGRPVLSTVPDFVITGSGYRDLLVAAAAVGDVNNDGFDDFLVGAPGNAQPYTSWTPGRALLFFGGATLDAVPDLLFNGEHPADKFGSTLAGLGDINADGHNDFVITAPWWPHKGYRGKAYVYFGGPGLDNVADLTFSISEGELGIGLCPGGDFTGDGHSDLLIGAYKKDMPGFDSGAAWLYIGGPGLDAVADLTFGGENSIDWFGSPLAWVGDLNGDGYNDLAMGASKYPNGGDQGRAYIYFGGPALDTTPDLFITGEAAGDLCAGVAGGGDLNGDGFADFMVGASRNDEAGINAGKVYLFFGGPGLDAVPDIEATGESAGDHFGVYMMGLGDVNGDNRPDFAVGASRHNNQTGRVYIYTLVSPVVLDIKPGSCPNPLNLKPFQKDESKFAKVEKGGVLPVAIVGSESLDVTDIDATTVLLGGVEPIRHRYEDVTAPPEDGGECPCTQEGPDGFTDMTLKFRKSEIAEVLGSHPDGQVLTLTITGELNDGTPFEASDCVVILSREVETPIVAAPESFSLGPAVPNPFNPSTRITYVLPEDASVTLTVYDVAGRPVERLFAGPQTAGEHVVEWDATGYPSGVYYYRLEVGDFTETRTMILLK